MRYSDLYDPKPPVNRINGHGKGVGSRSYSRRIVQEHTLPGIQRGMRSAKLNYSAGLPSKFRQTQTRLGGSADAHYANRQEFWAIREGVREYDRNTPVLGQIVDRGLDQCLGPGLRVDPNTGDPATDETLAALDKAWTTDPEACDFSGRLDFSQLERLGLRHRWVDGDCFYVLDEKSGSVRLVEGDRVTSAGSQYMVEGPNGTLRDLVHGVELDSDSATPLAYWFVRNQPGERQRKRRLHPTTDSELMLRIPREQVIHVYEPKRVSQTRGMSAFSAVFDLIPMHGDTQFAQLVQQQVAACIAAFITADQNRQWGSRSTETGTDGTTSLVFDEFSPGMIARLAPGESVSTFSPNNPNSDARELIKQIVREIGLAIGMPLELSLLVTSDTTFHGFRGALESWKQTARVKQQWFSRILRSRVYEWKVGHWIEDGLVTDSPTIRDHQIRYPAWQYVDPLKDAQADELRISSQLASPRQVWAERGLDYDQGIADLVNDKAKAISLAQEAAKGLGAGVTWRDVLGLDPVSVGVSVSPEPPPAPQQEEDDDAE